MNFSFSPSNRWVKRHHFRALKLILFDSINSQFLVYCTVNCLSSVYGSLLLTTENNYLYFGLNTFSDNFYLLIFFFALNYSYWSLTMSLTFKLPSNQKWTFFAVFDLSLDSFCFCFQIGVTSLIRIFLLSWPKKSCPRFCCCCWLNQKQVCVCLVVVRRKAFVVTSGNISMQFCELNYATQRTCSRCRHDKNLRLNTVSV